MEESGLKSEDWTRALFMRTLVKEKAERYDRVLRTLS
jgi:hypothetical protein